MIPKPKRIKDKEYLEYIREHNCLLCRDMGEPHHLTTRGSYGSDYTAIPLCRSHHSSYHDYGIATFEVRYHINVWKEAHRLLEGYYARMD